MRAWTRVRDEQPCHQSHRGGTGCGKEWGDRGETWRGRGGVCGKSNAAGVWSCDTCVSSCVWHFAKRVIAQTFDQLYPYWRRWRKHLETARAEMSHPASPSPQQEKICCTQLFRERIGGDHRSSPFRRVQDTNSLRHLRHHFLEDGEAVRDLGGCSS